MADNISGGIRRLEADGAQQFTMAATPVVPSTVSFLLLNTEGSCLSLVNISAANSGQTVLQSLTAGGSNTGNYHIEFVMPNTPGFYTSVWYAYDSASRPGIVREEFEVIRSEPRSFFSYGNIADVYRTARQVFGRGNVTAREIQDYMEPADDFINGHLGQQFSVPVSPVPPEIREWNKSVTLWHIYTDRFAVNQEEAPPGLKERYDAVVLRMSEVLSGNGVLHVQSGTLRRAAWDIQSTTEDFKPVFDSRDWEKQRFDPDLVDTDAGNDDGTEDA